jgi:hypothetical protein
VLEEGGGGRGLLLCGSDYPSLADYGTLRERKDTTLYRVFLIFGFNALMNIILYVEIS